MRRHGLLSGGVTGYTPSELPPDPITVAHAWVGNVSSSGATIKLRSTDAVAVTLRYSTDPGLAGYLSAAGSEGADDVWTVSLTGLTAGTQYYFGFAGSDLLGQFQTFAAGAASFTIAAGSCHGDGGAEYPGAADTSNSLAFDRIRERNPAVFLHMGDLHYRNLNTTNAASYRTAYKDVLANERFAELVRSVPTAYIYDDHDYGPNDSDGTYSGKATAQQVYGEYVPHWPLDGPNGEIYQSFVIGRVRFITLDARSERSPNGATDNSSKTRLGVDQKQWLKDELLAATEPLIVLDVKSWIGNTTSFADGWESFSTERTELFDYFVANDLMGRLLLIGGDIHELLHDDGTNTNFATGAVDPGPPYFGFAPLDASFNDFSATAQNKYQSEQQQYGTIAFVDDGTAVVVTVKGYSVANPSGAETERMSVTLPAYIG